VLARRQERSGDLYPRLSGCPGTSTDGSTGVPSYLIERKAEAAPPPRATAGAGTGTGGQDVDLRPPLRTLQALNVEGF
jgi:hypothetical protein